ncbi:hypothetical protein B0H17DRAFT_1135967 [Mycena rosella]|uniref:Uncharacterized protein n=1 Tax=Mycena rosella TaxID=1033263 RepID=A0AAD7DC22_MYCRO|nr:hypothetical protein B0H17DRAFT_1135967 [Mycena rosella]
MTESPKSYAIAGVLGGVALMLILSCFDEQQSVRDGPAQVEQAQGKNKERPRLYEAYLTSSRKAMADYECNEIMPLSVYSVHPSPEHLTSTKKSVSIDVDPLTSASSILVMIIAMPYTCIHQKPFLCRNPRGAFLRMTNVCHIGKSAPRISKGTGKCRRVYWSIMFMDCNGLNLIFDKNGECNHGSEKKKYTKSQTLQRARWSLWEGHKRASGKMRTKICSVVDSASSILSSMRP